MRLLTRYLTREVLAYAAGVFVLILGVFLVRRSALLLADLTEAALPLDVMAQLLALRTLMALPSLLPAVLYIATLLARVRLNENRDLEALQASVLSRPLIYRSLVPFVLGATATVAIMSMYGRPWAAAFYLQMKADAVAAAGTDQMRPGRFYELDWGGEQVVFSERRAADDARFLEGVFLQQQANGRKWIHFAERALEQRDEAGRRRLLGMFDGRRYGFPLDADDQEIIEYSEMVMAFPLPPAAQVTLDEEELSLSDLLRSTRLADVGELQWRLAMPLSTLVLLLLALPLTPQRAGAGFGGRLFVALLLYVVYRQVLGTGKRWLVDGLIPAFPGLLPIHAAFLLIALALLAHQAASSHGGWRRLLRRSATARGEPSS